MKFNVNSDVLELQIPSLEADIEIASQVINSISPGYIFPMHHATINSEPERDGWKI